MSNNKLPTITGTTSFLEVVPVFSQAYLDSRIAGFKVEVTPQDYGNLIQFKVYSSRDVMCKFAIRKEEVMDNSDAMFRVVCMYLDKSMNTLLGHNTPARSVVQPQPSEMEVIESRLNTALEREITLLKGDDSDDKEENPPF